MSNRCYQCVLGIDPGLEGAFVQLSSMGGPFFFDMPIFVVQLSTKTKKGNLKQSNKLDMHGILAYLAEANGRFPDGDIVAVIERQQAMPDKLHQNKEGEDRKQGSASGFVTGMNYGILLALLVASKIRYEVVAPVSWKKKMMADMGKEKDASRIRAMQIFPQCAEDLKLKKHHNRADALLIAEYGRRYLNLGVQQPSRPLLTGETF